MLVASGCFLKLYSKKNHNIEEMPFLIIREFCSTHQNASGTDLCYKTNKQTSIVSHKEMKNYLK